MSRFFKFDSDYQAKDFSKTYLSYIYEYRFWTRADFPNIVVVEIESEEASHSYISDLIFY